MIEERCGNGHVRTPATTYVNPSGKRQCRLCSGKLNAMDRSLTATGRREGEVFTPRQLADLRYQVRCMGCGAVPQETGETRENTNQHGDSVDLPVIVTEHHSTCPVAAQEPRSGRPKKKASTKQQMPCGDCERCGRAMTSAYGRPRRYCTERCRQQAKRARLAQSQKQKRAVSS